VVKRAGKRTWRPERVVWVAVGGGGVVAGVGAGIVLAGELDVGLPWPGSSNTQSWLDPIGRYGDRLAAHKELQRFLLPRENLVGAGVLRPGGGRRACSHGGPCARMWLMRLGALPEPV
jgi:hypothetical protein